MVRVCAYETHALTKKIMIKGLINNKVIICIAFILIMISALTGCSTNTSQETLKKSYSKEDKPKSETVGNITLDKDDDGFLGFDVLAYRNAGLGGNNYKILVDKNTKVMYSYIESNSGYGGMTITPLLNKDGKPLVYNEKEHYTF